MIKILTTLLFTLSSIFVFAQNDSVLYQDYDVPPKTVDGKKDPSVAIFSELRYPHDAQENGVSGKVVISFIVKVNGDITDINVVNPVYESLDKETLRVFKKESKGLWIPGKIDEKYVDTYCEFTINFILDSKDVKKTKYYYKQADKYFTDQNYAKAIEYLEMVRTREPFDFDNLKKLAIAYDKLGDIANSCKYRNRLVIYKQIDDNKYIKNCNN